MVILVDVRSPAPRDIWVQVLKRDPEALITQTPDWLDCICQVGPYRDASRLYQFDDGRRVVVPLAGDWRLPGPLRVEASWPFDWGAGGPVADGPLEHRHADAVFADLALGRPLRMTVRPGPHADPVWTAGAPGFRRTDHTTYTLDLAGGFGTVWERAFRSSVRRAIRKAERSAVQVEADSTGLLLPVFEHLYSLSVARWAEQQHEPLALARWRASRANPPRKMSAVAQRLGDRCTIWVAWVAGEPAAAIIVLRHGAHAKYWRGAMDPVLAAPTRANDLLHRRAIEDACLAGCSRYHMGDSRPGSGLATFKAGFGARPRPSPTYRAERLPLTALDERLRSVAKATLRFRDA